MTESNPIGDMILPMLGGLLGGMLNVTMIRAKDWREWGQQLVCSIIFAGLFSSSICAGLRWKFAWVPKTPNIDMAVAGVSGMVGFHLLFPVVRYVADLKNRKLKDVAGEWTGWLGWLASRLSKEKKP